VRAALASLAGLSGQLEDRLAAGLAFPGPLGAAARSLAGRAAGVEAGVAVGYAGRRVLGQYDLALDRSERPARLLMVEPNLVAVRAELGADPEAFLAWIALHETTHAVQFSAVPWIREHLATQIETLIEGTSGALDAARVRELAKRLFGSDPRRTVRALLRGELARLLAGPEHAATLDRIQATMSVIEGHAEHVMDNADPGRAEAYATLRARIEARRGSRGGLGEAIARLLGLELKLRQYQLGKRFCDAVVGAAGIDGLNQVWASPEALPSLDELDSPARWLERAGGRPAERVSA
jgi:coenzyme F420 biosynthesis associated uncharacterized protein